jgi:hypothetical protein
MPNYIICSNNKDDLGSIKDINLCPYFSTTYATIQLSNLSTIANIQILNEDDYVEFRVPQTKETPRLEMGPQQGMSYETLPNLINTFLPRQIPRLQARLNSLRKLVFVDNVDYSDTTIEISYMTYNYRILLGYYGSVFPIQTVETTTFGDCKSPQAKFIHIEGAEFDFPYGVNYERSGKFWQTKLRDVQSYCCIPVIVKPDGVNLDDPNDKRIAVDYRFEYSLDFGKNGHVFCSILPATGTITVFPYVLPRDANGNEIPIEPDANGHFNTVCHQCDVICKVFEGKAMENPKFTLKTKFYSPDPTRLLDTLWFEEIGYSMCVCKILGKKKLFFGEATRISLQPLYDIHGIVDHDIGPLTLPEMRVTSGGWRINGDTCVLFYDNRSTYTVDNFNSVLIQAESKIGRTVIFCDYEVYLEDLNEGYGNGWQTVGTASFEVEVLSPTLEFTEKQIVPPMVGSGLSTSVLYLISNCGTQSHRNTFGEAEGMLSPAIVSAIIQNAFSPSFPLQAGSDITGRIPTASLTNLFFKLVDANFYPVKLLSPLYLTLSVNEVMDPVEDLTPFIGKLPKDRPTPEQAQQMAQQQQQQDQEQKEQEQSASILQQALSGLIQQFREEKVQQIAQQEQQQAYEQEQQQISAQEQAEALAEQGIDINSLIPPPPPPPPPTDEEILQQEQAEAFELEQEPMP